MKKGNVPDLPQPIITTESQVKPHSKPISNELEDAIKNLIHRMKELGPLTE